MKLMLLVSAMNSGGAERVAATLCNAWAARGDEVTLVATYSGGGDCQYPLHPEVRLVYLADRVRRGRLGLLGRFGYPGRLLGLRRLIRETAPDAVVAFLTNVNVSAILATRGLRVPLVVSERIDPLADQEATPLWRQLRRVLYPRADVVTVQTAAGIAAMRRCVPRAGHIAVVPNPIPEQLHEVLSQPAQSLQSPQSPPPGSGSSPSGRRRLVALGRLAPQKQWHHLVAAFASLAPRHPDVDLWIWGEGPERAALEGQVAHAGLQARVVLPGRTASPWRELAAGDVFALTSAYEGFPNVLLEAMALGLPCVSYDCPSGPLEISDGGRAAALVRLNDRPALEKTLDALLSDPARSRALGSVAARSVAERFGLPSVLQRWDEIIALARSDRHRSSGAAVEGSNALKAAP